MVYQTFLKATSFLVGGLFLSQSFILANSAKEEQLYTPAFLAETTNGFIIPPFLPTLPFDTQLTFKLLTTTSSFFLPTPLLAAPFAPGDTLDPGCAPGTVDCYVEIPPAGSDGQIQYNNSSSFGGASGLFWDDGNNYLGIGDTSPAALLTVGSGDLFQVNSSGQIAAIAGLSGASGTFDFGGVTSFELPNSATPTVDANGEIAIDTTVTDFSTGVLKFYSGEELGVVAMPIAEFSSPSDGYVVSYNATNDEFELAAASGGGAPAGSTGDLQINNGGSFAVVDGASLGTTGNARGTNSLDLQSSRSAVTQVASGNNAVAIGIRNTASGAYATATGYSNTASTYNYTSAFGYGNTASAVYASALGAVNTASGNYSTALGTNNTASGDYDAAIGRNNTSAGYVSTSLGIANSASGYYGSAIGWSNEATENGASAVGHNNNADAVDASGFGADNVADAQDASAFGSGNTANGQGSSVFGFVNDADGIQGVAIGFDNINSQNYATAIGYSNRINVGGTDSVAIGSNNTTSASYAVAFGLNNTASASYAVAFGQGVTNNTANSLAIGPSNTAKLTISSAGAVGFANGAFTFPTSDGTSGQVLQTNGSGTVSWATVSGGGSVSFGSDNQIPYTNSSTDDFDYSANFTFDGTGMVLQSSGGATIIDGDSAQSSNARGTNALDIQSDQGAATQVASGTTSTAIGQLNTASSTSTTAVGYSNTVSSYLSSAFGYSNSVTGANSTAIGYSNSSTNGGGTSPFYGGSTAVGRGNTASGYFSTAVGALNTASAARSSAFGYSVNNSTADSVEIGPSNTAKATILSTGTFSANALASATANDLCYDTSTVSGSYTLSTCSSSERYKDNISNLSFDALEAINQLRAVEFDWKNTGEHDFGFIAEETADVNPLFASYLNDRIEGVKYKQLVAVAVEAIQQLDDRLTELGVEPQPSFINDVVDGVKRFGSLIVSKITVGELTVKNEDDISKTGITIYDRQTGEPVCMFVEDGEIGYEPGECGNQDNTDEDEAGIEDSSGEGTIIEAGQTIDDEGVIINPATGEEIDEEGSQAEETKELVEPESEEGVSEEGSVELEDEVSSGEVDEEEVSTEEGSSGETENPDLSSLEEV